MNAFLYSFLYFYYMRKHVLVSNRNTQVLEHLFSVLLQVLLIFSIACPVAAASAFEKNAYSSSARTL